MPCKSTLPRINNRMNWHCTGEDLIIVMWHSIGDRRVPVVVPRDRLADVMREPEAVAYDKPTPLLVEGDHVHLILPEPRPTLLQRALSWLRRGPSDAAA